MEGAPSWWTVEYVHNLEARALRLESALAQAREALQLALSGGDVELHIIRKNGEVKRAFFDWKPGTKEKLLKALKALEGK